MVDEFFQMRLDAFKQEEVDKSKYNFPSISRPEEIRHTLTSSLISIGINPDGKDLLEIIAELADEFNKIKVELHHVKNEIGKELGK